MVFEKCLHTNGTLEVPDISFVVSLQCKPYWNEMWSTLREWIHLRQLLQIQARTNNEITQYRRLFLGFSNPLWAITGPSGLLSKQALRMPYWDTSWLRTFLFTFYNEIANVVSTSHFFQHTRFWRCSGWNLNPKIRWRKDTDLSDFYSFFQFFWGSCLKVTNIIPPRIHPPGEPTLNAPIQSSEFSHELHLVSKTTDSRIYKKLDENQSVVSIAKNNTAIRKRSVDFLKFL